MKRLPLYIADIETSEDMMLSLSLTTKPATGLMGKVLHDDGNALTVFFPVLPANTPIYRNNEIYGEHNVIFLPDVIRDIMEDAHRRHIPFDVEHQGTPIKGVYWLESWQVDYQQGKLFKGYQGLTDGSWCSILKLVKRDVCSSSLPLDIFPKFGFGLSISGIFSYHKIDLGEAKEMYNNLKIE